jgi:uncharacterized protein
MSCRVLLVSSVLLAAAIPAFAADRASAPPPIKASFDCATAKSKINHLICSDAGLAALDVRAAQMLRRAKSKAVTPDAVDAEQDVWLAERNGCGSVACLIRTYQRRIQQLRAWTD